MYILNSILLNISASIFGPKSCKADQNHTEGYVVLKDKTLKSPYVQSAYIIIFLWYSEMPVNKQHVLGRNACHRCIILSGIAFYSWEHVKGFSPLILFQICISLTTLTSVELCEADLVEPSGLGFPWIMKGSECN